MNFKSHLSVMVVYFNTFNLESFPFLRILLYLYFDTSLLRNSTAVCILIPVKLWVLFLNPLGKAPLLDPFPLLRGNDGLNYFGVIEAKDFTLVGGLHISYLRLQYNAVHLAPYSSSSAYLLAALECLIGQNCESCQSMKEQAKMGAEGAEIHNLLVGA